MLPVDRGLTLERDSTAVLGKDVMERGTSDCIVGRLGRKACAVLRITGDGAYTITESGVSVRMSTGRRRSCSMGSGKESLMPASRIDARLCLGPRGYGEIGGQSFDAGFGEGQVRRLFSDLWLLTLLRLDDLA